MLNGKLNLLFSGCLATISGWYNTFSIIWVKVFKNVSSKIRGRQPLKILNVCNPPKAEHTSSYFLKAIFHKFFLVHFRIP